MSDGDKEQGPWMSDRANCLWVILVYLVTFMAIAYLVKAAR